ncbi:MAG: EAL domain-containing protein [Lachnospiraceae bacterium]|nr:EAL domain-containing protein [Lachnospiraceae bacterium]
MDEMRYQLDLLTAMNQKLASGENMYKAIVDTSSCAFLFYDFEKDSYSLLGEWEQFFDFNVVTIKDFDTIVDAYEEEFEYEIRQILSAEKSDKSALKAEVKRKDSAIWNLIRADVSYDEDGTPTRKIIRFQNITKEKIQNEELQYLAYYDYATGLYGRNHFISVASDLLAKAKENSETLSVLFIDIDNFKQINDGMGMLVGDEVIQAFGQFLKTLADDNIVISHFSSDIYCMAIYASRGSRSVDSVYRLIKERCNKPFYLTNNVQLTLSVCIGVAEYPEAADDIIRLINFAEIVMFKAKQSGKNDIQYFDRAILKEFLQNGEMEKKIKEAIEENAFEIHYQPQFTIQTGTMRGVEALVRMKDRDGSLISPALFIPIAEKNGTIVEIGDFVLEESVRTYAEWKQKYHIDFMLSINISPIQYKKADFTSKLLAVLEKYDVSPEKIELELTESVLVEDMEEVKQKMFLLSDYGIKVSLDDFGTGFSSLSYLKGLPIHTLKIDKSFADTIGMDESSEVIMESIVALTKRLGYETVAEGIETKEQMAYLKQINCDNIQGFLLSKPITKYELEQLIIRSI